MAQKGIDHLHKDDQEDSATGLHTQRRIQEPRSKKLLYERRCLAERYDTAQSYIYNPKRISILFSSAFHLFLFFAAGPDPTQPLLNLECKTNKNTTRLATNKLNGRQNIQPILKNSLLSPLRQPPPLAITITIILNLTANIKHHLAVQALARQRRRLLRDGSGKR